MKPAIPKRIQHADNVVVESAEHVQRRVQPYVLIGQVATAWSALEYAVDDTLWTLAGVSHELGACITAHLPGMGARLDALLALLDTMGASKNTKKNVGEFKRRSADLGLKRNRVVHDPIALSEQGEVVVIRQVVKDRKLLYGSQPLEFQEYSDLNESIHALRIEFIAMRKNILTELSLDEKDQEGTTESSFKAP